MIILGLHDNHSASVCLLVDGEVVAVACIYQSYNDFATKRYPKFKIKDFLVEEKRYWLPILNGVKALFLS